MPRSRPRGLLKTRGLAIAVCHVSELRAPALSMRRAFITAAIVASGGPRHAGPHRGGGVRLCRPPPTLAPPPCALWSDAYTEEQKGKTRCFFESHCPISPHTRDCVLRGIAAGLWQKGPTMILMSTLAILYKAFCDGNILPGVMLRFSAFKKLAPWNPRKATRDTCPCTTGEHYKRYFFLTFFA